jgi:hypothetical protein
VAELVLDLKFYTINGLLVLARLKTDSKTVLHKIALQYFFFYIQRSFLHIRRLAASSSAASFYTSRGKLR